MGGLLNNATVQDIDPGCQTSPQIINGHTFVPIKAIIEKLGGTVGWDGANQKITVTLNNTSIELNIGSETATVNGVSKTLDNAPFLSAKGRTMVPPRFVSENLGYTVNWNPTTKTITIQ